MIAVILPESRGGSRRPSGSRTADVRGSQECVGVAKLLTSSHFRSFPVIPLVDGVMGSGVRLGLHPHPRLDSSLRWSDARFPSARERRGQGTGMRGSRLHGNDGGVNPGLIWPCLALFTPTVEAENEAGVASFGPPVTRRHWASWPWLASSGVAVSGETFNSVAFGCISSHSSPNPHPGPLPEGEGVSAFA